ncbi:MAG: AI-2E family transporter [Cyclobacteriaceae bacterium]|nr:AI-2E family transporter [Cyclobacteriaceae bacterium]UYN87223.1 MAG: AI-2E family transporter [Cyclobacteriaceae bacterium]
MVTLKTNGLLSGVKLQGQVNNITTLTILQYIVFGGIILYVGRPLFIPLSFALLISCILYPICIWLEQHKIKKMTAIILSLSLILILIASILFLFVLQLRNFSTEWSTLQAKLSQTLTEFSVWITREFNISEERQNQWLENISQQSSADAMGFLKKTISAGSVSAVLFILIPVYVVLMLYHRDRWVEVLYRIFPSERKERIREILHLSIASYYNFIKGMLLVYLIVGILNSLGLYMLGIPHPVLFGFTASILTFIPYAGILIASLLPITISWVTYNSIWYPIGVIAVFSIVQYLEANVIFPLAVSSRLKLNALVTIAAIVMGGVLWGVAGLILFIPFLGILKLIADRTPALKTWALVLGGEKQSAD